MSEAPDRGPGGGVPAPGVRGGEFQLPEFPPVEPPAANPVGEVLPERRRRGSRGRSWHPEDRTTLDRAVDAGLRWGPVGLLLFAPLAWGSVEPWSEALLLAGAAAIAALWLVRIAVRPAATAAERGATTRLRSWSAGLHWPLAALLLVAILQLLPLGPLVGVLSPASAELYRLAGGAAPRLSAAPSETARAAAEIAALGLLFLAVLESLRSRAEVRTLAVAFLALGFAHAVGGILWHFTGGWRAYGLASRVGTSFGPYVNRNHFANLMAMTIPLGVGYLLSIAHRRPDRAGGRDAGTAPREREAVPRQVLAGFAVVVMAGALALSLSRAGIVSACVALAAFSLAAGMSGATRGRVGKLLAAAAAGAAFAVWLGGDALLARLATVSHPLGERSFTGRIEIWGATARLAADFPLFGSGFGSFAGVFAGYQTAFADAEVLLAHGDWLQLLAEGGLAGALAALVAAGTFLAVTARVLRRRRDAEAVFLALGGLAGLAAFVAHGTAEFSLHVPANALWFTVLGAWTLKASASRTGTGRR